jgi:hypothetical protein
MKSEAVCDSLFIGKKLQQKMDDFSESEIQFFSYLACLLSLYDGKTVDQWKCTFIKSSYGSPYSSDISLALETLNSNQSIQKSEGTEGYYNISSKGDKAITFYQSLSTYAWRIPYLDAACNSISLIPFGTIKEALNSEPVLRSANNSTTRKNLLENNSPATKSLHNQFALLKIALENKYSDLIIPAIVWLESLKQSNQKFLIHD